MAYLFKKTQSLQANTCRTLRIKNVKFLGYHFFMNTKNQGDIEICISVPLICNKFQKHSFVDVLQNSCFKIFSVFTGDRMCWTLFLIKLQRPKCFPVNNAKFLRAVSYIKHLWWLLLKFK